MIVTFYSFKGGVGRSMALANLGRWFQMCGLNVVVVDWDLEAPGLEAFYLPPGPLADGARDQLGLIDLLNLYKQIHPNLGFELARNPGDAQAKQNLSADLARLRERLPPMLHALIDIPAPSAAPASGSPDAPVAPGSLKLLCAGWRGGERFATYANAVQSFDWNDFYASYHGRAYFEWLRESLCAPGLADIVLIDSRTGVTEMGGVCTRQMADVVVVLTAPNHQNIDGAGRMADSFRRKEVMDERAGRPLELILVPSRVDVSSSDVKVAFEQDFRAQAQRFVPEVFSKLERDFWDLRIPYIAKYAFMERLAVGERDGDPDLLAAYKSIAAHIAWLAPEESRVKQLMRSEFERVFGVENTRIYLASDRFFARAIAGLVPRELEMARRVLTRLVTVAADEPGARDSPRLVAADAFDPPHQAVIRRLLALGLVREAEGKRQLIGLRNDDFVTRSELKHWVDEDRSFLLWRQKLRTYIDDWEASGREPGALLQGSLCDTAQRMREARPAADLFDDEVDFIHRSAEEAQRMQLILDTLPPRTMATLRRAPAQAPDEAATSAVAARPPRTGWWAAAMALAVVATAGIVYVVWPTTRAAPPQDPGPTPALALKVDDLVKQGQSQASGGDALEAAKTFSQALDVAPASRDALLGRARARKALNDSKGAMADLDALLNAAPTDAEALLERATALADADDPKAALADLDRLAASGVATASVLLRRGKVLEALGDDKAALDAYAQAVKLSDGKNTDALFARGAVRERLGDKAGAAHDFSSVSQLPGDELTRTAARTRYARLLPSPKKSEAPSTARHDSPSVQLFLSDPADLGIAEQVAAGLSKNGYLVGAAPRTSANGNPQGMVRYFSAADADSALKLRRALEQALADNGYKAALPTLLQQGAGPAGSLAVTLPPLNSPRRILIK
jgi:tetratricopeptide (TPR) repeat protein